MKNFITKENSDSGDDSGSVTGWGAKESNSVTDELKLAVTATGQTPTAGTSDDPTPNQLSKALTITAQTAHSYQDSGFADTYVLTRTGSLEQPLSYVDGMSITFRTANVNTGASVVNVSGLGVKKILTINGNELSVAQITVSRFNALIYDSSADTGSGAFILNTTNIYDLSFFGNDLAAAVAAIGSDVVTLTISEKPDDLTENLTWPKNITLDWKSGAELGGAFTVTLNGQIIAGKYKLFEDELTVNGDSSLSQAVPQWFGEIELMVDCSTTLQKAVDSFLTVYFPSFEYYLGTNSIELRTGSRLVGQNKHDTELKWAEPATECIVITDKQNISVNNLNFNTDYTQTPGDSAADFVFRCFSTFGTSDPISDLTIDNCIFRNTKGGVLFLKDVDEKAAISSNILVTNCSFYNMFNHGVGTRYCSGVVVSHCYFENTIEGLAVDLSTGTEGAQVTNNSAKDVKWFVKVQSFYLAGDPAQPIISKDCIISDNVVYQKEGTDAYYLILCEGQNVIIADNLLYANTGDIGATAFPSVIRVTNGDVKIHGNIISNSWDSDNSAHIYTIYSSTIYSSEIRLDINNNVFEGKAYGNYVEANWTVKPAGFSSEYESLSITNNQMNQPDSGSSVYFQGIQIRDVNSLCKISGNTLNYAKYILYSVNTSDTERLAITDNVGKNTDQGIFLSGGIYTDCLIADNVIESQQDSTIFNFINGTGTSLYRSIVRGNICNVSKDFMITEKLNDCIVSENIVFMHSPQTLRFFLHVTTEAQLLRNIITNNSVFSEALDNNKFMNDFPTGDYNLLSGNIEHGDIAAFPTNLGTNSIIVNNIQAP